MSCVQRSMWARVCLVLLLSALCTRTHGAYSSDAKYGEWWEYSDGSCTDGTTTASFIQIRSDGECKTTSSTTSEKHTFDSDTLTLTVELFTAATDCTGSSSSSTYTESDEDTCLTVVSGSLSRKWKGMYTAHTFTEPTYYKRGVMKQYRGSSECSGSNYVYWSGNDNDCYIYFRDSSKYIATEVTRSGVNIGIETVIKIYNSLSDCNSQVDDVHTSTLGVDDCKQYSAESMELVYNDWYYAMWIIIWTIVALLLLPFLPLIMALLSMLALLAMMLVVIMLVMIFFIFACVCVMIVCMVVLCMAMVLIVICLAILVVLLILCMFTPLGLIVLAVLFLAAVGVGMIWWKRKQQMKAMGPPGGVQMVQGVAMHQPPVIHVNVHQGPEAQWKPIQQV